MINVNNYGKYIHDVVIKNNNMHLNLVSQKFIEYILHALLLNHVSDDGRRLYLCSDVYDYSSYHDGLHAAPLSLIYI